MCVCVRVCLLPLPAAVQSDWLGEVREAKRRLLLTLWWQTGRKCLCVYVCVADWLQWYEQQSAEAINQLSLNVTRSLLS